MRGTRIDDCWGGRWRVRARYERHAEPEGDYTRRLREPALHGRLAPMLGSQPSAPSAGGWPPDEGDRLVDEDRRHATRLASAQAASLGSPLGAVMGIRQGVRVLTEPADRFWVVDLKARGRIRRGATWRVAGREEAAHAVAVVADAVRTGQVPELADARLIDVVDERLTVHGAPR